LHVALTLTAYAPLPTYAAARLGWVPLETEQALEELSEYAPEPAVYTFLRQRLNSFGLQTLFELHYHMITLGKVFCEKRTPNCSACPLRDMCEYASSGGKHLNDSRAAEPAVAGVASAAASEGPGGAEQENAAQKTRIPIEPAAPATPASATGVSSSSTARTTPALVTSIAAAIATAATREAAIDVRAVPEVPHEAAAAATAEILEASKTPEVGRCKSSPEVERECTRTL